VQVALKMIETSGKKLRKSEPAVTYFRTSSASNVGESRDTIERQQPTVFSFANQKGLRVLDEFYDAAVSGADAIEDRPGFAALLDCIRNNGVRNSLAHAE